MAVTESTTRARIIRGGGPDTSGHHAFVAVSDLPRIHIGRPSGEDSADPIRSAAWDEGFQAGLDEGRDRGYADGLEAGRSDGLRAGHADGLAAGRAQAADEIREVLAPALAALDQATDELAQRQALAVADIESAVVDLAVGLVEAILGHEITAATDPGRDALVRALDLVPDHGDVTALMNPTDLELMVDAVDLFPGRRLTLAADPSIARGGCVLEVGAARVDARIDTAIERVRGVLQP
ncbi:MAG: FliH/SctL family protein [Acidimicrobiales bacterium]